MDNVDDETVKGFGDEWSRMPQDGMSAAEIREAFEDYFHLFPWDTLPVGAKGADFGCGSGRWAAHVAPRVGHLTLVDASQDALAVAQQKLAREGSRNVTACHASLTESGLAEGSLDFAYCLGVVHHMPDTEAALAAIAKTLAPGARFLVYIYYALENRPEWFRALWRASDKVRRRVSALPHGARFAVSQALAATVYWPIARTGRVLDRAGLMPDAWPLSYYRDRSFYTMRTDALDRFGTRLEKRFTKDQTRSMLERAGFRDVTFSDRKPYWTALCRKALPGGCVRLASRSSARSPR
jgi:SAM-dependent methyltransferase